MALFESSLFESSIFSSTLFESGAPFEGGAELLDFNALSGTLPPWMTFARASDNGTRFNASGTLVIEAANVPRFDYDPATLAPLGLLVEPTRTNLLRWSEKFDDPTWILNTALRSSTLSLVSGVGPSGEAAYRLDVAAGAATIDASLQQQVAGLAVGTAISHQIFARSVSGTATIALKSGRNGWYTGTRTLDGQWRLVSDTYTGSDSTPEFFGLSPQQTGALSLYLLREQIEVGAFPTSYIPTTTAAATREADVATATLPAVSDILVQDREGGLWIPGVSAGSYNLTPRSNKRHITRWRAFPAGYAASHPELAMAYP